MARSLRKGPFVDHHLYDKVVKMNQTKLKKSVKTWSRRSMVLPDMIGHTFDVHNGKKFISVYITENMVGHRLGEFSPTRVFKGHGSKRSAEAAGPAASAAASGVASGVAPKTGGARNGAAAPAKPQGK